MNAPEVLDVVQEACYLILKLSAPMVLTALALGVVISLIQAITQIQEMTLTFVPKLIAVLAMALLVLPMLLPNFIAFTHILFSKIAG